VQGLKPPSQVTGVALSKNLRRGRPSLIVTWTAPQSDAPISQYRIQYKRTGAVFWGSEAATAGPPFPTSVTLISLAVATNYIVRVRATSPAGEGIWSEEQTERTYRCKFCAAVLPCLIYFSHEWTIYFNLNHSVRPRVWLYSSIC